MIKSVKHKKRKLIEIDLTGPDGNAFVLLNYAKELCLQLGLNYSEVSEKMMSSDYENLVKVFDEYFGEFVILYR
jgi:hypothetical protein